MIGTIYVFFLNTVDLFFIAFFMICVFKPIDRFRERNWLIGFMWLILVLVLYGGLTLKLNTMVTTILLYIVMLTTSAFALQGELVKKVLWSMVILLLMPVINVFLMQMLLLVSGQVWEDIANSDNLYYLITASVAKGIYCFILILLLWCSKKHPLIITKTWGTVWLITLGFSFFIEMFLFKLSMQENGKLEVLVVSLGVIVFDVFFIVTMYKISEGELRKREIRLLEISTEYKECQIRELQREDAQIVRIRHNYKNHMSILIDLMEKDNYEEAKEYLKSVYGYYPLLGIVYIETGYSKLDAILNTRYRVCIEENIAFHYQIEKSDSIDSFEIGTILLNLFDNAIDASKREKDEREICLEIRSNSEYVSYNLKNKISHSVLEHNPNLQTDKKDKDNHGIGLIHVKELVAQMGGMQSIGEENGYFYFYFIINHNSTS